MMWLLLAINDLYVFEKFHGMLKMPMFDVFLVNNNELCLGTCRFGNLAVSGRWDGWLDAQVKAHQRDSHTVFGEYFAIIPLLRLSRQETVLRPALALSAGQSWELSGAQSWSVQATDGALSFFQHQETASLLHQLEQFCAFPLEVEPAQVWSVRAPMC